MGAVATFDYPGWVARYPEFSQVAQPTAQAYFNEATIYHANDVSGPVRDATVQLMLLNMVTAHIAQMNAVINGQPAPTIVGRISQASEGSVSVTSEYSTNVPGQMAWFIQTKYGAAYWQATAPYRTMRYRPGAPKPVDPFAISIGRRTW